MGGWHLNLACSSMPNKAAVSINLAPICCDENPWRAVAASARREGCRGRKLGEPFSRDGDIGLCEHIASRTSCLWLTMQLNRTGIAQTKAAGIGALYRFSRYGLPRMIAHPA